MNPYEINYLHWFGVETRDQLKTASSVGLFSIFFRFGGTLGWIGFVLLTFFRFLAVLWLVVEEVGFSPAEDWYEFEEEFESEGLYSGSDSGRLVRSGFLVEAVGSEVIKTQIYLKNFSNTLFLCPKFLYCICKAGKNIHRGKHPNSFGVLNAS